MDSKKIYLALDGNGVVSPLRKLTRQLNLMPPAVWYAVGRGNSIVHVYGYGLIYE